LPNLPRSESGELRPDLRPAQAAQGRAARFENSVTNGKNQMPPWKGVLDSEQLDAIWAYIRANANDR
jgi:mono/diheme cytochrome c family protein